MVSMLTGESIPTLLNLNSNAWATSLVIFSVCVEFLSKKGDERGWKRKPGFKPEAEFK
jgi:hypothetical protein